MAELLTDALMLEQLQRLLVAFPTHAGMKNNPSGTTDVYRDAMHGLSGESLRAATRIIIESDTHFPKVARVREVAWEWTKRHRTDVEPELADPFWCNRCQSTARYLERWKPRVDEQGFAVLKDVFDGEGNRVEVLVLDRFERLFCRCAEAGKFVPDDSLDIEYAAMRTSRIKWRYARPGKPRDATAVNPWKTDARQQHQPTPVGGIAERILEEAAVHADA